MNKRKNLINTSMHQLQLHRRVVDISVDNYIEKEIMGELFNIVNEHMKSRLNNLSKLVNNMPCESSNYRLKVHNRLKYEIKREITYSNYITIQNKIEIPEVKDFSLILFWIKYSRRILDTNLKRYNKILFNTYQDIYNKTGNNKLKIDLSVQRRILNNKFMVILNLLQSDIYGTYMEELEGLLDVAKTYIDSYDHLNLNTSENTGEKLDTTNIKEDFLKVSSSRYLNKLAKENNFIKVGQSGSHAQFKHSDGRLVTIPQGRDLGKGLSIKIQKDIRTNRLNEMFKETKRLNVIGE